MSHNMPELAEVETVLRGLAPKLINRKISEVTLYRSDLRKPFPKDFAAKLQDGIITHLSRRSKYIIATLDNAYSWIIHLGMTGRLTWHDTAAATPEFPKHTHFSCSFVDGGWLSYTDPRRFGLMNIYETNNLAQAIELVNLGPEPLEAEFNIEYLHHQCTRSKRNIKQLLMDSNIVVGVGNIYASESLFRAGILPTRLANSLNNVECKALIKAITETLLAAIEAGGSSIRDFQNSGGEIGYFQKQLRVYGRTDLPCIQCESNIKRIVQNGRSTYFCEICQR